MHPIIRRFFTLALLTPLLGTAQDDKPYQLFVGVDLLIKQPDATLTVASLKPGKAIVESTAPRVIPLAEIAGFSWDRSPKVGRATVVIEELKTHRTGTIQQDAAMKWMSDQSRMAIYQQEKAAAKEMEFYQGLRNVAYSAGGDPAPNGGGGGDNKKTAGSTPPASAHCSA